MDTISAFPKFRDGDVYIIVSATQSYQLHSSTLRRLSPFFEQQIESFPGARLTAAARREGAAAYRFELHKSYAQEFGRFVRIRVGDNGKPIRDQFSYPEIPSPADEDEARIWEWLFASFYNMTPKFEDHNLAVLLRSCMQLVDAADSVGSIEHVREIVDLALLRQDQVLWRSIAKNPTAWTELGRRIHSQSIFREGMIHLVGLWNKLSEEDRSELDGNVRSLCEKKHTELDLAKQAINMRIVGHYPSFLSRSHVDKPQRTSYSTDIYMWMAISFFRHFYAQAVSERRTHDASDGGFLFYTTLAEGGSAYLHHEDFESFYRYFPMSSKACNVLEANMNVLKEDIKIFVRDLVVRRVHVLPEEHPISWFTCAVIDKEDMPWVVEDKVAAEAHQQQVEQLLGIVSVPAHSLEPESEPQPAHMTGPGLPETPPQLVGDFGYSDLGLSRNVLSGINEGGHSGQLPGGPAHGFGGY